MFGTELKPNSSEEKYFGISDFHQGLELETSML